MNLFIIFVSLTFLSDHDFNNDFTLFTAVPVLHNMYTDKDSNLISEFNLVIFSK